MARDPVCGMEVKERTAKFKSTHKDKIYYFCSKGCKDKFDADPQRYTFLK